MVNDEINSEALQRGHVALGLAGVALIYVDDMKAPFGRMIMCHCIGDTAEELHAMMRKIGVARRWYQRDHYDISLSKRALAVENGAKEITWRECSLMTLLRRRDLTARLLTPKEGLALMHMPIEERAAYFKKETGP